MLSTVKVPSNNIEQLLDQWEMYTKTIVMQNEYILSAKVFTRMYGPEWTVATLLEYAPRPKWKKASSAVMNWPKQRILTKKNERNERN